MKPIIRREQTGCAGREQHPYFKPIIRREQTGRAGREQHPYFKPIIRREQTGRAGREHTGRAGWTHIMLWIWSIGIVLVALAVIAFSAIPLAARLKRRDTRVAIQLFRKQREMLEAKFFDMARSIGKPRGLIWVDCEWFDNVTFARDRTSGLLTAFVGINIRFEAVEGGDMEGVAAVGTIRDAVAVFHFHRGSWSTGGKALFNMNPQDALERLVAQFEPVRMT